MQQMQCRRTAVRVAPLLRICDNRFLDAPAHSGHDGTATDRASHSPRPAPDYGQAATEERLPARPRVRRLHRAVYSDRPPESRARAASAEEPRMLIITVVNDKQNQQVEHESGPLEFGRGPQLEAPRLAVDDIYTSKNQL